LFGQTPKKSSEFNKHYDISATNMITSSDEEMDELDSEMMEKLKQDKRVVLQQAKPMTASEKDSQVPAFTLDAFTIPGQPRKQPNNSSAMAVETGRFVSSHGFIDYSMVFF